MEIGLGDIIPHHSIFIDITVKEIFEIIRGCLNPTKSRSRLLSSLCDVFVSGVNPNPPLPCLSVRSGLDLWLSVHAFPPGSELIMSALNIPDMVRIVRDHGLTPVPLDVDLSTLAPNLEHLPHLITPRTVAILVAHIFGKRFDVTPYARLAHHHHLPLVEDCAEAFSGLDWLGHSDADLSLFSFGTIKHCTAFGGAVAKVRDVGVYEKMSRLLHSYPRQGELAYLYKVFKYSLAHTALDVPSVSSVLMRVCTWWGVDYKARFVAAIRAYPTSFYPLLRQQPSTSLLSAMLLRLTGAGAEAGRSLLAETKTKGDYVSERLPGGVVAVGQQAQHISYWLYPVLVECPDDLSHHLNHLGVDAYRGSTQMNVILPDSAVADPASPLYPHQAQHLVRHVLYLPVNRLVPYQALDHMIICLHTALAIVDVRARRKRVKLKSKL